MNGTPARILIVDEDARNLDQVSAMLKTEGYVTQTALSGESGLGLVESFKPDLILLDSLLSDIDGYKIAGRLKLNPATKAIPIIMVIATTSRDARLHALEMGAEEFLARPIDRTELWVRVRNLLRLRELHKLLEDHNRILEEQVSARTRELHAAYKDTIYTMVRAAEFKDDETGNHVQRISLYCRDMAEAIGMGAHFREQIFYASPMHDIGKIGIPDAVLLKPGSFTPAEWEIMKSHAALGARILEKGRSPYTKMGAEIALCHHERWDGSGYPNGLRGEEIPLAARLMNMADQYDALRSKRPHKPPFSHARAVEIITKGDGRTLPEHFDPQVLEAFGRCAGRWREIYDSMAD